MATHIKCVKCDRLLSENLIEEIRFKSCIIRKCRFCNHSEIIPIVQSQDLTNLTSKSGDRLRPYQEKAVKAIEAANFRIIIADQQGLGKTPEILAALAIHPEKWPFLIICKATLKAQMIRFVEDWCGIDKHDIWKENPYPLIVNDINGFFPGFPAYIVSFAILRRVVDVEKVMKRLGIKVVIIDECQAVKNTEAQQTAQVMKVARCMEGVVPMSGTPIENHAGEYFPALNMVKPELFPTQQGFISRYCQHYNTAYGPKVGALADPAGFKERTKEFIIRRTRSEVLPDLPAITRNFRFCDLGDEVAEAYEKTLSNFTDYFDSDEDKSNAFQRSSNILAYMSRMRHLTGLSKVDPCIDFLMEFLGSCNGDKTIVFLHHLDVGNIMQHKLVQLMNDLSLAAPLKIQGITEDKRDSIIQEFKNGPSRILLAGTLASGEGLNLQFCHDLQLLEREWNPSKEEQAEARIVRFGQAAEKLTATYFVAVGTIDEKFADLVEAKRVNVDASLNGTEVQAWNESDLIRELAEVLASQGRRKWSATK